jgi:hypothetical protein
VWDLPCKIIARLIVCVSCQFVVVFRTHEVGALLGSYEGCPTAAAKDKPPKYYPRFRFYDRSQPLPGRRLLELTIMPHCLVSIFLVVKVAGTEKRRRASLPPYSLPPWAFLTCQDTNTALPRASFSEHRQSFPIRPDQDITNPFGAQ